MNGLSPDRIPPDPGTPRIPPDHLDLETPWIYRLSPYRFETHTDGMDSRRMHHRAHLNSSDSNSSSPASPSSPALGGSRPGGGAGAPGTRPGAPGTAGAANAFANDGSFMEMFKKKMEAEKKRKEEDGQTSGEGPTADPQEQSAVDKKPPSATSFVRVLAVVR